MAIFSIASKVPPTDAHALFRKNLIKSKLGLSVKFFYLGRACHKLPEISQKVAPKKSKVAFCNERCSRVAKKARLFCFSLLLDSFIWPDTKIFNLCNKSNISKYFCAFLR